jgi:hypothetical protein
MALQISFAPVEDPSRAFFAYCRRGFRQGENAVKGCREPDAEGALREAEGTESRPKSSGLEDQFRLRF